MRYGDEVTLNTGEPMIFLANTVGGNRCFVIGPNAFRAGSANQDDLNSFARRAEVIPVADLEAAR